MQVACQLCEFCTRTLLLSFLLVLADLLVMIVQVTSYFLVLRLNVLEVLLTGVEVMLPSSDIVSSVALNRKEWVSDLDIFVQHSKRRTSELLRCLCCC